MALDSGLDACAVSVLKDLYGQNMNGFRYVTDEVSDVANTVLSTNMTSI